MKKYVNERASVSPVESVIQSENLPCDPRTKQPIAPKTQPGYYPDYDVLKQQNFRDEATRKVVLDRLNNVPPICFFTADEAKLMQAVCDRLLPQDDRDEQHKIPLVNYIDRRLYERHIDGYRYEDMPPDNEAHRLGLQAIDQIAHHLYQTAFVDLNPFEQDTVLKTIHDGNPPAAQEIWRRMSVHHFWMLLMQDAVDAYYAHPYAWNEIGLGGLHIHAAICVWSMADLSRGRRKSSVMSGKRQPIRFLISMSLVVVRRGISNRHQGRVVPIK